MTKVICCLCGVELEKQDAIELFHKVTHEPIYMCQGMCPDEEEGEE